MKIIPIKLSFSNAYLVTDRQTIIVDTGMPGEADKILQAAAKAGVKSADISLILHTHAHVDHAGSTAALAARLGIPTAVHAADAPLLQAGKMNTLVPLRLESRLIRPVVNKPFPPITPDRLLDETFDLAEYGLEGRILPTPGHTAGSVSLLLPDGSAIVGDVMMGGYLGGAFRASHPNYHYFADNLGAIHTSIRSLLDAGVHTFYVGHGGPLTAVAVERKFKHII